MPGGAAMRRSTMLKTCDTRRFATAAAFTHAAEPRKTLWQTSLGYDTHVDIRTYPFPPNEIIRRAGDDEFMRASMSSASAPPLPTPWPAPSRMLQTGSVLVLLGHEPHVARAGCARVLRPHEDAPYLLALRE